MKITDIRTTCLTVPYDDPPQTGFIALEAMDLIVIEVETDAGIVGIGHLHPLAGGVRTIEMCIHEMLKPVVVGQDASDPAALWRKMWLATFIQGRMGITVMAQSGLDMALWDAVGKAAGQPLWQVWGGTGDPMKIYGSGCYRGLGQDGMIAKAHSYVDQGYRAIKMQVAHVFTPAEDIANVRAMRAALGDDIEIMIDVNQGWDVETAIATARQFQDQNIKWLEEPVMADDFDGYHQIAAAIEIPVVGGENSFCDYDMQPFFDSGAVPILQPDVMRGGYTNLRVTAEKAHAAGIAIAPHVFPELSCHLTASIPNPSWLENMGWYQKLWTDPLTIEGGMLTPPTTPGIGLTFRPEILSDFPYRGQA
ncbi:MAG: mandelate racemase/muconate lactonizing enzyme family protein [Pseudomonadota bacterium]